MKSAGFLSLIIAAALSVTFVSCNEGGNGAAPSAARTTYTLSLYRNIEAGGDIVVNQGSTNPDTTTRLAGSNITITAWPWPGYEFLNWEAVSGDLPAFILGSAATAIVTFKMNSDVCIRPNFQPGFGIDKAYKLDIYSNVEEGYVVVNNCDITNESIQTYHNKAGSLICLEAHPASGYAFDRWTGETAVAGDVFSPTVTFAINSDVDLTAHFYVPGG